MVAAKALGWPEVKRLMTVAGVNVGMGILEPRHAARLGAAIETILADPSYARAAGRVADEMAAFPSIDDLLAGLTREPTPPPS